VFLGQGFPANDEALAKPLPRSAWTRLVRVSHCNHCCHFSFIRFFHLHSVRIDTTEEAHEDNRSANKVSGNPIRIIRAKNSLIWLANRTHGTINEGIRECV
jgi:hypothetical protein